MTLQREVDVQLLIGGSFAEAGSGASFERRNPYTGDVVSRVAAATVDDANRAADAAAAALPAWSQTSPTHRRIVLLRAADLIVERTAELAQAMAEEIGSTPMLSQFNVEQTLGFLREAASLTTMACGETIPTDVPGSFSLTVRKPIGVCLAIAPWNGPLFLGARAIAYPLAFGNTVVFKASEQSPRTHALLVDVFLDAGVPAGALNAVYHRPEDGADITNALIAHPAVQHINFTGSSRVGRFIAEAAARQFKRVLLELGGKAPVLVLEDADLTDAARAAALGGFFAQGQACISTERIVVVDSVADELVSQLARHARNMPAGDPASPENVLGCMVNEQSAIRVHKLVTDAVDAGAVLVAGGTVESSVLQATVLDRVTPDMDIYYDETFGPVVVVIRVADEDAAVAVANDSAYGLSSAVWSSDVSRALRIAARLDVGMCHINGPTVQSEAQAPFGGVKSSGWGQFGGQAVIPEFTTLQWITISDLPGRYPPFLA